METPKSKRGGARPGAGRKPKTGNAALPIERVAEQSNAAPKSIRTGRPSDFRQEFVKQAQGLCKLGATDQELADFFEVDVRTIYRWKATQDAFCQALKVGKQEADDRVERSLFARATGYEHNEVDIRVIANRVVQTPIRKFYPPDTAAAIFWLKNRRKEDWRDKIDHEHSGSIEMANMTDAQLDEEIRRRADSLGLTLQ